jgi:hypothetical protein
MKIVLDNESLRFRSSAIRDPELQLARLLRNNISRGRPVAIKRPKGRYAKKTHNAKSQFRYCSIYLALSSRFDYILLRAVGASMKGRTQARRAVLFSLVMVERLK